MRVGSLNFYISKCMWTKHQNILTLLPEQPIWNLENNKNIHKSFQLNLLKQSSQLSLNMEEEISIVSSAPP